MGLSPKSNEEWEEWLYGYKKRVDFSLYVDRPTSYQALHPAMYL